jgi:hypothetical protein
LQTFPAPGAKIFGQRGHRQDQDDQDEQPDEPMPHVIPGIMSFIIGSPQVYLLRDKSPLVDWFLSVRTSNPRVSSTSAS